MSGSAGHTQYTGFCRSNDSPSSAARMFSPSGLYPGGSSAPAILVLFGGYAAGWRIDAAESLIREREAIITLTQSGWGRNDPAYRQLFSSTFGRGLSGHVTGYQSIPPHAYLAFLTFNTHLHHLDWGDYSYWCHQESGKHRF